MDEQQRKALHQIKEMLMRGGNCKHEIWAAKNPHIGVESPEFDLPEPVLCLANDDDSHYVQTFRNLKELNQFIHKLNLAGEALWGDTSGGEE